jgi:hypothetical protein
VGKEWEDRSPTARLVGGDPQTPTKGGTVAEERERTKAAQDEQDVEAHRTKALMDEDDSSEPARRETDDESDVEAHKFKP